ncbi:MAG TPA: preprotein translocase subunit SecG [Clostridia bacterium]|nr:preprotein translocase subunit SecG [Clostridia bacterium]
MSALQIIASIMLFISSVVLVVIVLMQHGRDAYLGGAIAGGAAESFLGKNKARTIDSILSKYTKIIAVTFLVLTLVVNAIVYFIK